MKILGISCFYHDAAAVLIEDGKIVAAAQEERFTRIKQDPAFPKNAIEYCLKTSDCQLNDLEAIVFYDKPLLKFERLIETYYAFSPRGFKSFVMSITVWLKEKLFFRRLLLKSLREIDQDFSAQNKILYTEHHLAHSASAFFPSSFESSAIVTIDGVGEWATASISFGEKNKIKVIKELTFPHSVGLLYSAFTYYLGFKVNSGEYKLMGLAPYGNDNSESVKKYVDLIKTVLVDIKDDGSIWLNQKYFNYAVGLTMVKDKQWSALFGLPKRDSESELTQAYCDLALAIQKVTDEIVIKMAKQAKEITGSDNICLSGGVALNCVSNGRLQNEKIFKNIFIQPASGDSGGALGAATAAYYIFFDQNRVVNKGIDGMQGAYLGPDYSDADILSVAKKYKAVYLKQETAPLLEKTAKMIADGSVVGWFQGRMEFGPRALGNRSILGDARNPEMQKKLNLKIKFREGFRPFAPSVLAEDAKEYFELEGFSPYMLLVQNINKNRRNKMPANFSSLSVKDKLYFLRSDLPAITHIDYSARIQTVHKETNELYWKLIEAFKKLTGYGVIVNTSFNVRGEPIVCNPEDAYRCFMNTEMDYLVMGNFVFDKKQQPKFEEQGNWREKFKLD